MASSRAATRDGLARDETQLKVAENRIPTLLPEIVPWIAKQGETIPPIAKFTSPDAFQLRRSSRAIRSFASATHVRPGSGSLHMPKNVRYCASASARRPAAS